MSLLALYKVEDTGSYCDNCKASCRTSLSFDGKEPNTCDAVDPVLEWDRIRERADAGCNCCVIKINMLSGPRQAYHESQGFKINDGEVSEKQLLLATWEDWQLGLLNSKSLGVFYPQDYYVEPLREVEPYILRDTERNQPSFASSTKFREIYDSPCSAGALSLAREWIETCDKSHSDCQSNTSRPLPTRLIDVGLNSGIVHLIQPPQGTRDTYAALSYCWGPGLPFVATRSNINELQREIDVDQLSKTLVDAIHFTGLLKIRYLWIDALCIIQDDPNDWSIEAAKMGDIYANAFLTLAPISSISAADGFLHSREASLPHPRIAVSLKTGRQNQVQNAKVPVYLRMENWQRQSYYSRLDARAWCLQERILSRRILSFVEGELRWECPSKIWQESQALGSSLEPSAGFNYLFKLKDGRMANFKDVLLGRDDAQVEVEELHQAWLALIHEYSNRALSHEEDRLPAVSGLAHLLMRRTQDTYHAGIWRQSMHAGLAWCRDSPRRDTTPPTKNSQVQIPSWSWAAHPFKVRHLARDYSEYKYSYYDVCCIDQVETYILTADPCGQIAGGRLQLRCVYAKLTFNPWGGPHQVLFDDGRHMQEVAEKEHEYILLYTVKAWDDSSSDVDADRNRRMETYSKALCLIIEPISGTTDYRRIGFCSFSLGAEPYDPAWCDDWQRDHLVTLV